MHEIDLFHSVAVSEQSKELHCGGGFSFLTSTAKQQPNTMSSSNSSTTDGNASDLSYYPDADSTFEAASSLRLSDQTLLKQAFGVAVHSRRSKAKDWRHERENQIAQDLSQSGETELKEFTKNGSYSSKIRSLLRRMTNVGT